MIIKCDANGNVTWATNIGGSDADTITFARETSDGKTIAIAHTGYGEVMVGDYKLSIGSSIIKYDANKNIELVIPLDNTVSGAVSMQDDGFITKCTYNGGSLLTKYDEYGNEEWRVSEPFEIDTIVELIDKSIFVTSQQEGKILKLGQVELKNPTTIQLTQIGGNKSDYIESMEILSDGGYIVGGHFNSSSIKVGNYQIINNSDIYSGTTQYSDGMIIKYGSKGRNRMDNKYRRSKNEHITSVAETSDGGYIVGGYFSSDSITVGNYELINNNEMSYDTYDGMIIKYNAQGEVEWATNIGGSKNDQIHQW